MKKDAKNRFSIHTLGCSKNVVDSERLIGLLESNGLKYTEDMKKSQTLIINTCGFINPAKEESINAIFQGLSLKKQYKLKNLIVIGCLSERYSNELKEQIEGVDCFFGINSYYDVLAFISPDINNINQSERMLLTPAHYAYLKIADGCSHACSFCAIPVIKGGFVSRTIEDIITETKCLVNKGVKEFILIAQDTTYYGRDIYNKRSLAQLMSSLSDIDGVEWLRLMYAFPAGFPYEVLKVIAERDNICKYIDIPLQHISDRILKLMKRNITAGKIKELIDKIRDKIPGVAIRSTFIVGFPGETDKEFSELFDFIKEYQLERVGVFNYSHEDGTGAYTLNDDIPEDIKEIRRNSLMELQGDISLKKNKELIGKSIKVIVDERDGEMYRCRSEYDAPDVDNGVLVNTKEKLEPGSFVKVKVYKAEHYDVYAK
ncbi:MAG: ribosomal protein methylthiotransferase [Bacteroidota bacterium]|nr:ribosomal protein methylthiotransferase [Bacteroidota bacterium]